MFSKLLLPNQLKSACAVQGSTIQYFKLNKPSLTSKNFLRFCNTTGTVISWLIIRVTFWTATTS